MKLATTLFITLSAAVASAATTTYTPFTTAEGWTYGAGRPNQGAQFVHDATNGTMTLTGSNWGQKNASLELSAITLSAPTDSMTFSYTFYNNDNSAMASLALVGTDMAIVSGAIAYNANVQYAVTDVLPSTFSSANPPIYSDGQIAAEDIKVLSSASAAYTKTISGSIAWDATTNQFELSISDGTSTASDISLGSSVNFNQVYLSGDGHGGEWGWRFSDFSIAVTTADAPSGNIPEPTTATLSLLALAGLAARRRRK